MNLPLDQIVFNLISNKIILEERLKEIEETRDPFVIITDPHDEDDNDPPKYGRIYWYAGTHLNGEHGAVEFDEKQGLWACPGNIYPMRISDPEDPDEDRFILAEDYKTAIVTGARVREMMDFIAAHRGEPNMYMQFCNLHGPRETRDGFNDYIKGYELKTEESEPIKGQEADMIIMDDIEPDKPNWDEAPKDAQVCYQDNSIDKEWYFFKLEENWVHYWHPGADGWTKWVSANVLKEHRSGPLHNSALPISYYRSLKAAHGWLNMLEPVSDYEIVVHTKDNTVQIREKVRNVSVDVEGENSWLNS